MTFPETVPLSPALATHPLTWVVLFFALSALRSAPLLVRLGGVITSALVIAVASGLLPTLFQAQVAGVLTVLTLLLDVAFTAGSDVATLGPIIIQQGEQASGRSYPGSTHLTGDQHYMTGVACRGGAVAAGMATTGAGSLGRAAYGAGSTGAAGAATT